MVYSSRTMLLRRCVLKSEGCWYRSDHICREDLRARASLVFLRIWKTWASTIEEDGFPSGSVPPSSLAPLIPWFYTKDSQHQMRFYLDFKWNWTLVLMLLQQPHWGHPVHFRMNMFVFLRTCVSSCARFWERRRGPITAAALWFASIR